MAMFSCLIHYTQPTRKTYFLLEPLHGLLLVDTVGVADTSLSAPLVSHAEPRSPQDNVEVHAVDSDAGVVLDSQIDVFLDAKAKVAGVGEVALAQLVLANLG